MHQAVLAEILGTTQPNLSRMEAMRKDLTDIQYENLVSRYGDEDVKKYVRPNPLLNIVGKVRSCRKETSPDISTLAEIIRNQQAEIARLNNRIEELTNLLLKR
jgi:hypothetical protein